MVKSIRYIFTRIIIGVGIAFILMLLKGNLIGNVYADSVFNKQPSSFCTYNTYDGSGSCVDLNTYTLADDTFYGATYGGDLSRVRLTFRFNNLPTEKTYDIDGLIYLAGTTTFMDGTKGYIMNGDGNYSSCEVSNTRWGVIGSSNNTSNANIHGTASIHCSNVYIGTTNFMRFYLMEFNSTSNGTVAISKLTFKENVSAAIQEGINDIDDSINDDSVDTDNAESSIDDMKDQVASNGTITQLLTLPITLYRSILNSISGSCSSFNLGTLYNHTLIMPCINLQNVLGSTLYNIIDIMCCGAFILVFRKKMVDIFNHMTSLNDRGNEVE